MKTAAKIVMILLSGWVLMGTGGLSWSQDETSTSPEEGQGSTHGETVSATTETSPDASATEGETPSEPAEPEVASPPAPHTSSEPATPPATPASSPVLSASSSAPGLISVDFKDADIRQVLRIISLKSGVDIVAGNDVEGTVTIRLTNVPWEQALDITLRTYGFTYERKGNIVRVMTLASQEQEALATDVFSLDYAKAKEVPDVLKEMLSDRGKVKYDERTNTVIVTDIPTTLFQIKHVIERLDQRTPQVLIESKIVETRLNKSENLGIKWSESSAVTMTASSLPTSFPFPGGASFGNFGEEFIPTSSNARVPQTTSSTFSFGTLTAGALSATLNFLQSRTDTHIVSNPSISALNNQEARVHIGSEYPIPNYTIDPTTGRPQISGYTAKNIGTVLTVTPHVNPRQEIVVDLKPEVIAATDKVSFDTGSSSISLPQFTVQTAQTHVRIQNGETIAIGGLVKEADSVKEEKVPFLGDLPIVGFFFKNVSRYTATGTTDPVRQDLLIFLTVKLTDEPSSQQTIAAIPQDTLTH